MTAPPTELKSIVVERYLAYPAQTIWRALTDAELLGEWLMPGDFQAIVGHRFTLRADPVPQWNGVTEGEVLEVRPCDRLVYRWHTTGAAPDGLSTTVTWTLHPTEGGTLLRMEQSGFRSQDEPNFRGATAGWQRFITGLERTVASLPPRPPYDSAGLPITSRLRFRATDPGRP